MENTLKIWFAHLINFNFNLNISQLLNHNLKFYCIFFIQNLLPIPLHYSYYLLYIWYVYCTCISICFTMLMTSNSSIFRSNCCVLRHVRHIFLAYRNPLFIGQSTNRSNHVLINWIEECMMKNFAHCTHTHTLKHILLQ